jgi:hypothetical protein
MGHLDESQLYRHYEKQFIRNTLARLPVANDDSGVSRAWARRNTARIDTAMDVDAVRCGNTLSGGTIRASHSASAFPGYGFTTLNSFA